MSIDKNITMSFIHLVLEAKNDTRTIDRVYEMRVSNGLFNGFCIHIAYGRASKGSTVRTYPFPRIEDAHLFWKQTLLKRSTAEQRFGCAYTVKRLSHSEIGNAAWVRHFLPTLSEGFSVPCPHLL